MKPSSSARIYLSDQRGMEETDIYRRFYTYNGGNYFSEHRKAFGPLHTFTDHILAGGGAVTIRKEAGSCLLLLPVIGATAYYTKDEGTRLLAAGQALLLPADQEQVLRVSNPFDDEAVNFLEIGVSLPMAGTNEAPQVSTYELNEKAGSLVPVFPATASDPYFSSCIGKFKGREETVYTLRPNSGGVFVFVLQGAFEVEGRLLHERDGLALWDCRSIELEALSNDAIIWLMDLGSDKPA